MVDYSSITAYMSKRNDCLIENLQTPVKYLSVRVSPVSGNIQNIPAAAAGEDALRLRLTGAEQLIVWQILNSTHLLLDILTNLIPPVSTRCLCNSVYRNHRAFESFTSF